MESGMFLIIGYVGILLAAVVESFCTFSRTALPQYKPGIMKTWFRWVMEALWVILLLGGGVMLLADVIINAAPWYFTVIAISMFWLIFPLLLGPIMRRRFLPHWEEVRKELAPKGLHENNYWRDDWWMIESKRRKKKVKPAARGEDR